MHMTYFYLWFILYIYTPTFCHSYEANTGGTQKPFPWIWDFEEQLCDSVVPCTIFFHQEQGRWWHFLSQQNISKYHSDRIHGTGNICNFAISIIHGLVNIGAVAYMKVSLNSPPKKVPPSSWWSLASGMLGGMKGSSLILRRSFVVL